MIKNYNNITNSTNISVETKRVVGGSINYVDKQLTTEDALFVKVNITGLNTKERIVKANLVLYPRVQQGSVGLKVYKTNLIEFNHYNMISMSSRPTTEFLLVDKTVIKYEAESTNTIKPIELDLTNEINGEINGTKTVVFMIKTTAEFEQNFEIYDAINLANEQEEPVSLVVQTTEVSGLKGIYKYDSYPISNVGKMDVNLFDGNAIYSLDLFQTTGHMRPMGITLYNNPLKENQVTCLPFNLTLNYHYKIYQEGEYYVIEDPTGAKNYYSQLDREDETTLASLHIKHLDNNGDIYFSNYDCSYFYVSGSSTKSVELYDQNDNYVKFNVGLTTKIMESKDSYGRYQTYTWSQDTLEKITNVDREEILFSYDSLGYIQRINFTKQSVFINFTRGTNYVELRKYYTGTRLNSSSMEEPWDYLIDSVRLEFNQNKITLVKDLLTGYYLTIEDIPGVKAFEISYFKNGGTDKEFCTTYEYSDRYTVVKDYQNNSIYYMFDNFGRVMTIIDDKGKSITYNYDEYENGESKHLVGVSRVQKLSRNLIENPGFENEQIFESGTLGWKKAMGSNSKVELSNEGLYGNKCLNFVNVGIDISKVYQDIRNVKPGTYKLSGYFKGNSTGSLIGIPKVCVKERM